jgi:hypothetical protein
LFTQEINVKEESFGISSPSTSREDHEARHKSRHAMNMTPNDLRTEASTASVQRLNQKIAKLAWQGFKPKP